MEKFSSRRKAVLEVVQKMRCHPTADAVYEECRKTIPNISLATVYRNLAYFERQGILGRVVGCGEKEHYDVEMDTHCHVICSKCKKIVDMPYPEDMKSLLTRYCKDGDFKSYGLTFFNVCDDCKNKVDV